MNKLVTLVMGDWSDDGHGKTSTYVIDTNLTKDHILAAYKKGTKKIGFDMITDLCEAYEDNSISPEQIDMLVKSGLKLEEAFECVNEDESCVMEHEFFHLFCYFVKVGNPTFTYEEQVATDIKIGGYGLFQ